MDRDGDAATPEYAIRVANDSYVWYKRAAIRSRRHHRWSAIAIQVLAAAIPVAAVINPDNATAPAILGAAVVVLGGARSTFDWQENYLRFNASREAVEGQRRLYRTAAHPYDDPATRDRLLVAAVTRIERNEMLTWFKTAAEQPTAGNSPRRP
jgi:Protein of unknown function (DUF4231)